MFIPVSQKTDIVSPAVSKSGGPEDNDWYYGPWLTGEAKSTLDKPIDNPKRIPAGFYPQGTKKPKTLRRKARKR